MTDDNDLIRRSDVLDAMCKGPRTVQERIDIIRALPAVAASQPSALETCGRCMGSGYGGHPDSGALCINCNGSGGVAAIAALDPRDAQIERLVEDEEAFVSAVWDALKSDTNDLRRKRRILEAFRAAVKGENK